MCARSSGCVIFRGFRVQLGMVTGSVLECKPCRRTGRADYFGPQLNLAARIANSAHGGQTLIGSSTYNAIHPRIMYELDIQAFKLGSFSLKGVHDAEIIYQVGRLLCHASVSEPCAKTGAGGTLAGGREQKAGRRAVPASIKRQPGERRASVSAP